MKRLAIFIFLSFLVPAVWAKVNYEKAPRLFPGSENAKVGYIDITGKIIIRPQLDFGSRFSEGLAIVFSDPNYWYINSKGRIISETCSVC